MRTLCTGDGTGHAAGRRRDSRTICIFTIFRDVLCSKFVVCIVNVRRAITRLWFNPSGRSTRFLRRLKIARRWFRQRVPFFTFLQIVRWATQTIATDTPSPTTSPAPSKVLSSARHTSSHSLRSTQTLKTRRTEHVAKHLWWIGARFAFGAHISYLKMAGKKCSGISERWCVMNLWYFIYDIWLINESPLRFRLKNKPLANVLLQLPAANEEMLQFGLTLSVSFQPF